MDLLASQAQANFLANSLAQPPADPLALFLVLLMALVYGSVLASFVAACAVRSARGESILAPASRCDACQTPLKWRHMVPIAGYLWLRGRSACCGTPIPRLSPVCEVLLGLFFMALALRLCLGLDSLAHVVLHALLAPVLLHLALMDALTGRLPDRVILPAIVLLLVCKWLFAAASPTGMLIFGPAAGLELLAVRHHGKQRLKMEVLGLGDVKLAVLLGIALEDMVFFALAVSSLAALLHAKAAGKRRLFFGPWLCAGAAPFLLV